jgi:AraC-like DNA-binding protein
LSRHPVYGRLITEAMQTLVEAAAAGAHADLEDLQMLIASLVNLAGRQALGPDAPPEGQIAAPGPTNRPDDSPRSAAQLLRVKRIIRARCTTPGYSVAACAAEAGLSERYIHRLFSGDEDSFGTYLINQRLNAATRMLRHPGSAHLPLATIALEAGFADPSHFTPRLPRPPRHDTRGMAAEGMKGSWNMGAAAVALYVCMEPAAT